MKASSRWRSGVILLLVLLLALAVRLAGLTERGLWLDELVSLQVASQPAVEIARGAVFDNHTPPLYYLLLRGWLALVPESLFTLRMLSVLFDLACLGLLVGWVRRATEGPFGRRLSLAVGAAYAVAPFAVRLAQEGRMYTLLMLLVVACGLLALEVDRRRDRAWPAVALAPVAAAALYTHYYAALSLLALHGVMAWRLRGDPAASRRWWGSLGVAGLLFVPWTPVVVGLAAEGGQFFRAFGVAAVPYALLRFAAGFSLLPVTADGKADLPAAILQHLPALAAVAVGTGSVLLLGLRQAWRGRPAPASAGSPAPGSPAPGRSASAAVLRPPAGPLAIALFTLPPLLALAVALAVPSLDERYLAVCFPFFLVLAALGVAAGGLRHRWPLKVLAVGIFALGAVAQLADPDAGTTPWRELAVELERRAPDGGVVVVRPAYYRSVLDWNLRHAGAGGRAGEGLDGEGPAGERPQSGESQKRREGWQVWGLSARRLVPAGLLPSALDDPGWRPGMASEGPALRAADPPSLGGDRSAWLVEVGFLTRRRGFDGGRRWKVREELRLADGNGLVLSRLLEQAAPPGPGALQPTDVDPGTLPPSPASTRPSSGSPSPPAAASDEPSAGPPA